MSNAYPGAPAPPPAPYHQAPRQGGPPAAKGRAGAAVLVILGVVSLAASAFLVSVGYGDGYRALNPAWINGMWRNVPAEKLFPATIASAPGPKSTSGGELASWYRVGIAPTTSCERLLSTKAQEATADPGCVATPAATYVDASGNMVLTVALVQVKSDGEKTGSGAGDDELFASALQDIVNKTPLLNTFQIAGTPAARWSNEVRNGASVETIEGALDGMRNVPDNPYVIVTAVGSTDGRLGDRLPGQWSSSTDDREPWNEAGSGFSSEYANWLYQQYLSPAGLAGGE